jgi:hypothetical protein
MSILNLMQTPIHTPFEYFGLRVPALGVWIAYAPGRIQALFRLAECICELAYRVARRVFVPQSAQAAVEARPMASESADEDAIINAALKTLRARFGPIPGKQPDEGKQLHCSFCGKAQHEVRKLIAGPKVYICNECVVLCLDILVEEDRQSGDDEV